MTATLRSSPHQLLRFPFVAVEVIILALEFWKLPKFNYVIYPLFVEMRSDRHDIIQLQVSTSCNLFVWHRSTAIPYIQFVLPVNSPEGFARAHSVVAEALPYFPLSPFIINRYLTNVQDI